jgi:Amt family ammonium transporter
MTRYLRTWGFALLIATATAIAPSAYGQTEDDATAASAIDRDETSPDSSEISDGATESAASKNATESDFRQTGYATQHDANILWICIAAALVFFMQAGFALVECGFTRAKNACNILMKVLMDFAIGAPLYWLLGFSLMFGATTTGWFAWGGRTAFAWSGEAADNYEWAFLLFQIMFATASATIVSGAMAERTKFSAYLVYTCAISVVIYPVFGSWAWNGAFNPSGSGWLEGAPGGLLHMLQLPKFHDFAGSTAVHSIGGWCSLAGAIVVGARIGKYGKDGRVNPIPGHSIPMGAMGAFILWMGWFGFNPGSTLTIGGGDFAKVAFVTLLGGCGGAIASMIVSWVAFRKPDPSFTMNGSLAGLVSVTAACNVISPMSAFIIGLASGVLIVVAVVALDRMRIDDPVGAIPVHLANGIWGTLAAGLFMLPDETGAARGLFLGGGFGQTASQAIGILAAGLWAFPLSLIVFLAIKHTIGLRVSQQEEIEGLDISEHGMYAYPPALVMDPMTSGLLPGHSSHFGAFGSPEGRRE